MDRKRALIFCVGRELLEGLVLDRNANFMAGQLSDLGYQTCAIQVVDDVEEDLVAALEVALQRNPDCVFVTGGMGPGHDDITRECAAKATKTVLAINERAKKMLTKSYRRLAAKGIVRDAELNEARLKMAMLPKGSVCYENPIGTAPAVRMRSGETTIFLLPGVPAEMQRIFSLHVVPALMVDGLNTLKQSRHIDYPGSDESAISRLLAELSRQHPGIRCKARVQGSGDSASLRITLLGEHLEQTELDAQLEQAEADLRAQLGLEKRTPSLRDEQASSE